MSESSYLDGVSAGSDGKVSPSRIGMISEFTGAICLLAAVITTPASTIGVLVWTGCRDNGAHSSRSRHYVVSDSFLFRQPKEETISRGANGLNRRRA